MNALVLLLALTTSTLVLRSGDRIEVQGAIREENGVVTFRSGGLLYSLPASEVDLQVTQKLEVEAAAKATKEPVRRLRLTPEERKRLLEALEKNHSGQPAPPQRILTEPRPEPTKEEIAEQARDEASWRREARAKEEEVRQAQEDLALLETQIEDLRSQIASFLYQGFKPEQFTYQSLRLERSLAQLPGARLAITRAQRSWDQFREDARRQGVLPGWLR